MAASPSFPDAPIFVLAPAGNDANNAAQVLAKAGISAVTCRVMQELCAKADDHAGALLISEETLNAAAVDLLAKFLEKQPPWSDLPIVLLTSTGEVSRRTYNILNFFGTRANVTLLEKPLRAITLISAIKSALRSRHHQYEVRNLLENYSIAMESAQMGSWDINLQTRVARHSARHDQIFGYEGALGEWSMEAFFQHILESDREHARAAIRQAETEGTLYFECRIRPVNQEIRWIAVQGRMYLDANAKPLRIAGVITDITERKEMELVARVQRERLDLVLEGTAVGLWYWDIPENRLAWNLRCKEHHGVAVEVTVTPELLLRQILPAYREQTQKAIAAALADGRAYDNEYKTARGKWIRSIGQVFFDEAGEPARFDGISMDITKRRSEEELLHQAQQELRQTADTLELRVQERTAKLEETVSEMEAFSYSVSHDLRAPLRAMQGYSRTLLNEFAEKLDSEAQEFLSRINKSAERLDRLTQDLLTYSRVVRNPVEMTPISLGKLVPEIIQQFPYFQLPHAEVLVEGELEDVLGHEASLTQCVSNLVGNAIKFVLPGKTPVIKISTTLDQGQVTVWFRDNGIGIEPDQLSRIFGIFERVSKQYEGTGIGLAIVRKAAERMGGAVGVESRLGEGSSFWLRLPAVKK